MSINSLAQRSRQITEILVKHGMTAIAHQAGLGQWIPLLHRGETLEKVGFPLISPESLVETLQDLGTTFVKLGQMLSNRPDVIPTEYCRALKTLTDSARPVDAEVIKDLIASELGADFDSLFESFDEKPLGVASVAQVHSAVLSDGREAVVKVRKPNVREEVLNDLSLLRTLAKALERGSKELGKRDITGLVDVFATMMTEELDFTVEAGSCLHMAELFSSNPQVRIPWVESEYTTTGVMTMEKIQGIRIDNVKALQQAGIDPSVIAHLFADSLMRMVFEYGVFHGDPHPGNVFVTGKKEIAFIDWGMTGRISPDMRLKLVHLLVSFSLGESELITTAILDLAPPRSSMNRAKLAQDIQKLVESVRTSSLDEINITQVLTQAFAVIRQHNLVIPTDVANLLRVLMLSEGVVFELDPNVSVYDVAERQARSSVMAQLSPERLVAQIRHHAVTSGVFAKELPQRLNRILERAESGEIDINMRGDAIEGSMRSLNRITNRLVGGMLTSAGVIAGALIYTATQQNKKE